MASTEIPTAVVSPPVVPSKWDIIPIHTSDRAAFKDCRRRWAWGSPSRRNLVPKASVMGVRLPLWFGTGIHYALERYYGHLQEDPVAVFQTWFHLQWHGGLIHESELTEYSDREPSPGPTDGTYMVEGLKDIMPFADDKEEEFMDHLELGIGMLTFFVDHAQRHDDFRVIQNEHMFSVPIIAPNGRPMYAEDNRIMPEDWEPTDEANKYGRLCIGRKNGKIYKQVHARGRMDQIIQENETGTYAIRDYKTVGKLDDDYFRHLELDEQCTTYLWAAPLEAELYGYEYTEINRIYYVALRKAFPRPPTELKNGMPSIAKTTESTTPEMFTQYIKDHNLQVVYDNSPTLQSYFAYLLEKGEKQFIWIEPATRNKTQILNAGLRLYHEAIDMLDKDLILYPNPSKNYTCLNCQFRTPCLAAEDGSDWKFMLNSNYVSNYDR